MDKAERVLHVVSSMNRGGAETMIMNLYRNIDTNKLQFDFICHTNDKCDFEDEILSLGGRIYRLDSLGKSGLLKYVKELKDIIKLNGPFKAVHAHTDFQSGVVALAAKLSGVKIRICHSHNTKWKESINCKEKIISLILKKIARIYGNRYCACGKDAAIYFFGENLLKQSKVNIINNGIDVNKFVVRNNEEIEKLKNEINIEKNEIIIGHIGRFYDQKNHKFIVKIASEMKRKNINFKVLLLGDGPLKAQIEKSVIENNLNKEVIFLGVRSNIVDFMHLFDVFIFPSLFEGVPLVLVEAQASGLKCVISSNITKEVDMDLNLLEYIDLDSSAETWIERIIDNRKVNNDEKLIIENYTRRGYNSKENINQIYKLYEIK